MNSKLKHRLMPPLDSANIEADLRRFIPLLSGLLPEADVPGREQAVNDVFREMMEDIETLPFIWAPYATTARDILENWEFSEKGERAQKLLKAIAACAPEWKDEWGKKPNLRVSAGILLTLEAISNRAGIDAGIEVLQKAKENRESEKPKEPQIH